MVERSTSAILEWSHWRRWHQAWARFYHYRGRTNQPAEPLATPASEPVRALSVEQEVALVWQRLEPLLPPERRPGRRYGYDRRVILAAIVYVMRTGCGWEHLPEQYPPWKTVHSQLSEWRKAGIWEQIWLGSEQPNPARELQL
jgi:hypothetical protein